MPVISAISDDWITKELKRSINCPIIPLLLKNLELLSLLQHDHHCEHTLISNKEFVFERTVLILFVQQ
jgi:hypothetical protein